MQHFFTRFSTQGNEVSLEALLDARENRALLQQQLLSEFGQSLLSVTLTAVGGVKKNALLDYVFEKALENLTALFRDLKVEPTKTVIRSLDTGHEAFFVLPICAKALKIAVMELEERLPIARLWDLDVFDVEGNLLSRADFAMSARPCLICGDEAKSCARNRKHDASTIIDEMQNRAVKHHFAEHIAEKAYQALLAEARLSPKPGLVDSLNTGAHQDMDLHTFEQSAVALKPFFLQFVLKGMETATLPENAVLAEIRPLGVLAEKAMFSATHGINTHKGAIFSFGLVCAAIGRLAQLHPEQKCGENLAQIMETVRQFAQGLTAELVNYPDNLPITAGVRLFRQYGLTGARGEAESGFQQIQRIFPFLENYSQLDAEHRLLIALLHFMATNPDTNVVHRGGMEGLDFVQNRAKTLLADNTLLFDKPRLTEALNQFNTACVECNLSAGGSADLLALTIFFLLFRGN